VGVSVFVSVQVIGCGGGRGDTAMLHIFRAVDGIGEHSGDDDRGGVAERADGAIAQIACVWALYG